MRLLRTFLHVIIALFGWAVFGWLWWRAFTLGPTLVQVRGSLLVGVLDLGLILFTLGWIWWNIRVYKKKGPRRTVRRVDYDYSRDTKGVPVEFDLSDLQSECIVVVEIAGEGDARIKRFYVDALPEAGVA